MKACFMMASLLLVACGSNQTGEVVARTVLPGQALATLIPGKKGSTPTLNQVTVFLAGPVQQGRLFLHLVEAQLSKEKLTGERLRLGTHDLLPVPVVLGPAQLNQGTNGQLTIPLARYKLQLPANGLFLVVECRPTKATDHLVAITVVKEADGNARTSVVLSPKPDVLSAAQVLPGGQFPHLLAQLGGITPSITYLRSDSVSAWQAHSKPPCTVRVEAEFADN